MKLLLITITFILTPVFAFASQVDLSQSELTWLGRKKIGTDKHTGTIKFKSARLAKDGKSGEFVVDMNSINVTDLSGKWKNKFEKHMKSDDFFDVANHPTSTLVIESVSGNTAKGKLTIKGKQQPVTVKYSKEDNTYTGDLKIDRTKYGVIYGSGNFFKELTADKIINDEFNISFKVVTK